MGIEPGRCLGRVREGAGAVKVTGMRPVHPEQANSFRQGWTLAPVLWCWSIFAQGAVLCCPQRPGVCAAQAQTPGQPALRPAVPSSACPNRASIQLPSCGWGERAFLLWLLGSQVCFQGLLPSSGQVGSLQNTAAPGPAQEDRPWALGTEGQLRQRSVETRPGLGRGGSAPHTRFLPSGQMAWLS